MSQARKAAEEIADIVVFWALKYSQQLKAEALADAYEVVIAKHFPPSPLVIAADQLAQAAEKLCYISSGCDCSETLPIEEAHMHYENCPTSELRAALASYRKAREGK
jgi:hypothetical protein